MLLVELWELHPSQVKSSSPGYKNHCSNSQRFSHRNRPDQEIGRYNSWKIGRLKKQKVIILFRMYRW